MKCFHSRLKRVLFLLFTCCSLNCSAFDVGGYKSGMSLQEAKIKAAELRDIVNGTDSALAISRFNSETRGFDTYALLFCENHLYQINRPQSFSASSFVTLLTNHLNQYGPPDIVSGRHPMLDYNHIQEVEFKWRTASDTIILAVNSPEKLDSIPKLVPGMIQAYVDTRIQCPKN